MCLNGISGSVPGNISASKLDSATWPIVWLPDCYDPSSGNAFCLLNSGDAYRCAECRGYRVGFATSLQRESYRPTASGHDTQAKQGV